MTTFALDLSKAIEKAKDQAELVVRKTAFNLFKLVIDKSPVDTGRFRGNWNPSIGSPDLSISDVTDKTGASTESRVSAVIAQYKLSDQSIYLTNNLPYAMRLEEGWSQKQAPNGMVRLSILEVSRKYGA